MRRITDTGDAIATLSDLLRRRERVFVFTGAGISVDSGVPDFRSPGGVWTRIDPATLTRSAIESPRADRARFWAAMASIAAAIGAPEPNSAHAAVAALEAAGRILGVATQNIDGLHQAAGSASVVELHGNHHGCRCLRCGGRWPTGEILKRVVSGDRAPDCGACGGVIRPDLVLFGDELNPADLERARAWARRCDLCLVLGSSLEVFPAAGLPWVAAEAGADVVIITLGSVRGDWPGAVHIDAPLGDTLAPAVKRALSVA